MKYILKNWMSILTICLCSCAMVVGVFALSNLNIQMSGQIGFNQHTDEDFEVIISGTIAGHSADGTPEGLPVPLDTPEDLGYAVFKNGSGALSLNPNGKTCFFTDAAPIGIVPSDIVITLNMKCNMDTSVLISLSDNLVIPENVSIKVEPELLCVSSASYVPMTITLSSSGTASNNIEPPSTTNLNILLNIEPYSSLIKSDIIRDTTDA